MLWCIEIKVTVASFLPHPLLEFFLKKSTETKKKEKKRVSFDHINITLILVYIQASDIIWPWLKLRQYRDKITQINNLGMPKPTAGKENDCKCQHLFANIVVKCKVDGGKQSIYVLNLE